MALIIAARFNTFYTAQNAASQLMAAGVTADNLHTFFVNPAGSHDRFPIGGDVAVDPAAEGAFMGAMAGAAIIGLVGALAGAAIGYAFGSSAVGILIGAGVGGYTGALAGAMRMLGNKYPRRVRRREGAVRSEKSAPQTEEESRPSGVLLAVNVTQEDAKRIGRLLRDAGGQEVERAHGRWEDGVWKSFDPLEGPELEKNL